MDEGSLGRGSICVGNASFIVDALLQLYPISVLTVSAAQTVKACIKDKTVLTLQGASYIIN